MTTGEYVLLRSMLRHGCMAERIDLVSHWTPKRFAEFVERLELPYADPLELDTWRMLAGVACTKIRDLLEQVESLERYRDNPTEPNNPCRDPLNSSCECPSCKTVSAEEELGRTPMPVKELNEMFGKPEIRTGQSA